MFDASVAAGSTIVDNISTYVAVKKLHNGIDSEGNIETREGMRREGVGKYLAKHTMLATREILKVGAVLYGMDYALGISDNALNLHHAFVYGISGLKYLAAATNTFTALGMKKAARVTGLPVMSFLKTVTPLVDKTIGRPFRIGKLTIPPFFSFGSYQGVS